MFFLVVSNPKKINSQIQISHFFEENKNIKTQKHKNTRNENTKMCTKSIECTRPRTSFKNSVRVCFKIGFVKHCKNVEIKSMYQICIGPYPFGLIWTNFWEESDWAVVWSANLFLYLFALKIKKYIMHFLCVCFYLCPPVMCVLTTHRLAYLCRHCLLV